MSVQHLETAYTRDAVAESKYTESCKKLISQFKTLKAASAQVVPNIDKFMTEYKMDCKAARHRLLRVGVPATVEYGGASELDKDDQKVLDKHSDTEFLSYGSVCSSARVRSCSDVHHNAELLAA
eukprot:1380991-Amorphochlora_amoeboformis.AAC.2